MDTAAYLRSHIRTVPDWPAPGVQFRDITPLLQDPKVFRVLIDAFVHRYMDRALRPDVVAGLDARGFIIGSVVEGEQFHVVERVHVDMMGTPYSQVEVTSVRPFGDELRTGLSGDLEELVQGILQSME